MPRMRVERVQCAQCEHHGQEGIVCRCYTPSNRYTNWMGMMYHEPPSKKNYNGKCPDYKEIINGTEISDN